MTEHVTNIEWSRLLHGESYIKAINLLNFLFRDLSEPLSVHIVPAVWEYYFKGSKKGQRKKNTKKKKGKQRKPYQPRSLDQVSARLISSGHTLLIWQSQSRINV